MTTKEIRDECRQVALREVSRQKEEFTQLGIMADWSETGTYRTLDHDYEIRQLRVFQTMVKKGIFPLTWTVDSQLKA